MSALLLGKPVRPNFVPNSKTFNKTLTQRIENNFLKPSSTVAINLNSRNYKSKRLKYQLRVLLKRAGSNENLSITEELLVQKLYNVLR